MVAAGQAQGTSAPPHPTTENHIQAARADQPPVYSRHHLAGLHSHLELLSALTYLESAEFQVDESLSKLLGSPDRLESSLAKIGHLRPIVSALTQDASTLHEVVVERAAVAERISSKVRVLDLEQNRVKDCIDRVQAATELKDAFGQLFQAIERADWEAATRHIQRANAIDPEFLSSQFAEAVVPTTDIPDQPAAALANFTSQLTDIFLKSFDAAARSKDEAATTRFFKLFPLLGPSASEAGLSAYSDFVRSLISVPSSVSRPTDATRPTSITSQFTSVFEQLALIIDQHQGMVDKYYGPRSMLTVVMRLNLEMDRLIGRLVSSWESDRQVDRKLTGVQRYSFTALTQLLAGTTIPGPANPLNSPAALQSSLRSLAGNVQRTYNLQPGSSIGLNPAAGPGPEEETEEPREIDALVAELAGMSSRWQTYRRFLYGRFGDATAEEGQEKLEERVPRSGSPTSPLVARDAPPTMQVLANRHLESLEATELSRLLQDFLARVYLPLEMWYLRVNIEKAHLADELDLNTPPYLSSALDDTFYMTKKVTMRLMSVGNAECVQSGLAKIKELVERDFGEVMRRRLEGVSANMGAGGGGFGIGSKMGEEKKEKEKMIRNSYVVYLNNLSMASEYIVRLIEEVVSGPTLNQSFFITKDVNLIKSSLEDLKRAEKKFMGIAKNGLEQLFNQLIRPRIRSILSDCYRDVNYTLDEESYAEAEFHDVFKKRFCKAWEGLMEPYRESLTPKNFHEFFAMTVHVLVRPWETMIRNMKFTELGAMRFDKDLRSITSYLSNQTTFGVSLINESFARLRQVSMLLGLNEAEEDLKDFLVSEEVAWRLTMTEIKGVLGQKC